jgi:hypothetical protein
MTNVLTAIYNHLPATIGGISKAAVILEKSWNMDGFHNSGARSDGYNADYISRVNLLSYYEWQTGLDTGSGDSSQYITAEPANNSVGDLWCRAQYSNYNNLPVDNNCLDHNIGGDFYGPWLRSVAADYTTYAWSVHGGSRSLDGNEVHLAYGVSPALWFSGAVQMSGGNGTKNAPYCLAGNEMAACLPTVAVATTAGSAGVGITLNGTAKASGDGQNMMVWADACNSAGQCVRKEFTSFDLASSGIAQGWTLSWLPSELPAGTYNGTIWVGLVTAAPEDGAVIDVLSAQSEAVNFAIDAVVRTFLVTVIENQPFSLEVGAVSNYDLGASALPATNNGVTASNVGGKLVISSSAGLASNTKATFGSTKFEITVIEQPQITVTNVSFE